MYPKEFLEAGNLRLKAAAAEAGLPFEAPEWLPNTHLAHEAAEFAEAHGQGHAFHAAVLRARFAEGCDIGDPVVLAAIGGEVGLDAPALAAALSDRRYRERVSTAMAQGQSLGVTSVPTFVLANGHALAGAQPVEIFEEALGAPPAERATELLAVLDGL